MTVLFFSQLKKVVQVYYHLNWRNTQSEKFIVFNIKRLSFTITTTQTEVNKFYQLRIHSALLSDHLHRSRDLAYASLFSLLVYPMRAYSHESLQMQVFS